MFYTKIQALEPYKNKVLFAIEFTKIVFQQNHFSRSYSHRMIILGTIPCPFPARGRVLTQLRRQMQERYKVARVKTDSQFGRTSYLRPKGDKSIEMFGEHSKLDRRERGSKKGSKNIEIYLVRLSDEGWEQEKWIRQEPSNPIWTAYGLAIYLAMPKRSVAAAPNISMNWQ